VSSLRSLIRSLRGRKPSPAGPAAAAEEQRPLRIVRQALRVQPATVRFLREPDGLRAARD